MVQMRCSQADWRMEVAKDIELLRRTGPFQLALLSHLRRDDKILPVMKAVWQHSLHSCCPDPAERSVLAAHWRPVAESLLLQVVNSVPHEAHWEPMLSQLQLAETPSLLMPGSVAVMQILLPQLQGRDLLHNEDFGEVAFYEATQIAAVVQRCIPRALCEALQADGLAMEASDTTIGLLAHDVMTEMTARACSTAQEWLGSGASESVFLHLHVFVSGWMRRAALQEHSESSISTHRETEDRHALRAILPAVAAVLLLPVSQQVASFQPQFPLGSWKQAIEPLLEPLPHTWKEVRECGVRAAHQLQASQLEESFCLSAESGADGQDAGRDIQHLHALQFCCIRSFCSFVLTEFHTMLPKIGRSFM